jgi:glycosyltransferase
MKPYPLVTIITASFNRVSLIEEAIASVLNQTYPRIEHLIMDGGSNDGTIAMLKKFPSLKIISEPDKGVYDAFNKGIYYAAGDIIGILNSDDFYAEKILDDVVNCFAHQDTLAVLGGASIFRVIDGKNKVVNQYPAYPQKEFLYQTLLGGPLTNAWFFRRDIFEKYGKFDLNFGVFADREFFLRMCLDSTFQYTRLDKNVYYYRQHSNSLTMRSESDLTVESFKESIDFVRKALKQPALSDQAQMLLKIRRRREYFELVRLNLLKKDWKTGLSLFISGVNEDPGIIHYFVNRLLSHFTH